MKKFLSLIVGLILSISSFAQYSKPVEYPKIPAKAMEVAKIAVSNNSIPVEPKVFLIISTA